MNQKRSSGFRILLRVIGGLIFIGLIIFTCGWVNRQFFSAPEINIIQPVEPLLINSGEGIILISHAKSTKGIDRVEFLVNGSFSGLIKTENTNARELVAQFPWMPEDTGFFNLSVIAYDKNNRSSKNASIPIGVISPNLSPEKISEIEEDLEAAPMLNVAVSLENLNDNLSIISEGQQVGEGENRDQEEIQHIHLGRVAGLLVFESAPPRITSLEVEIELLEDRVTVFASASAVDDVGVQKIKVSVYEPGIVDPVFSLASWCDEAETCDFANILELGEGDYAVAAIAVDTSGQTSEIVSKNIRVPSASDEDDQDVDVDQEPELDIPQGFLDQISILNVDDQENISSLPPYITSFTVQANQAGQNAIVDVWANAEDDNGIAAFSVAVYKEEDDSLVDILHPLCQGALNCDIIDQLSLQDGAYVFIAQATDIDQNESEIMVRTLQVLSNHPGGEPPSLVVSRFSHIIPAEAVGNFILHDNGMFEVPPHPLDWGRELDEELLDGPVDLGCGEDCEENTLDYVEVDIWYQPEAGDMDAQIVIAIDVPPGIPLPDGQPSFIKIYIRSGYANGMYTIMPLTESTVVYGAYKEARINASTLCNAADFYMDLSVGEDFESSEFLDRIHLGEIELLQCTTLAPSLMRISAFTTYADRIGNNTMEWRGIPQTDGVYAVFIDHYLITKRVMLPEGILTEEIVVSFGNISYRDLDVLPDTVYEYSLRVVGTNGRIGRPTNYLNVRTPPDGANYNVVSTDWQPNR